MPVLKTEKVAPKNGLPGFSYTISINQEGYFTTTLPKDVVNIMMEGGLKFTSNREGNPGYFFSGTLVGLVKQVDDVCKEYSSRELVSDTIVIKYLIQTTCTYCFDQNGAIVPNASSEWTNRKSNGLDFKHGTKDIHATSPSPYGVLLYVKPFHKKVYRYRSGIETVEYKAVSGSGAAQALSEGQYNLRWLASICAIKLEWGQTPMEIEYTEQRAKLFVDMVKGICNMNERLKEFAEDTGKLQMLADSGKLLLT